MKNPNFKKRTLTAVFWLSVLFFALMSWSLGAKGIFAQVPYVDSWMSHGAVSSQGSFGGLGGIMGIEVKDTGLTGLIGQIRAGEISREKFREKMAELGSKLYHNTLSKALNTIAYDTATWLGSGGRGQKPLFIKEGWGEYLGNVADNSAGVFLETLGTENGFLDFDLCQPSLNAKISIQLGLYSQYSGRDKPRCTFSEMRDNWERELSRPDFLSRFNIMFDPDSNDLGIALSLHSRIIEDQAARVREATKERDANQSWLDLRNIAGHIEGVPGLAKIEAEDLKKPLSENFGQITGSVLVDAANLFLNQLAITAINNLMRNLGRSLDTHTSPYDWGSSLYDREAGPLRGGIAAAKERFRKIIEPIFNVRGDYNILAELSACPDPQKAGPTNCVIDGRFQSAIEAKMTVAEAVKAGYLNPNAVFGFLSSGLEPNYIEGYPYRSMKILRKFRVIPVGWELAAQYIAENPNYVSGMKTLSDMINCFSPDDQYGPQSEAGAPDWCRGLVDPNWVLKAPLNYCKREGPGPEIISEQIVGSGDQSYLSVTRNEKYCADEQTCIQENRDGSCAYYGYCTAERRRWDFNSDSCDPLYNTCQTYRGAEGQTVSYLANTLDYGSCSSQSAGCLEYCEEYTPQNINVETETRITGYSYEIVLSQGGAVLGRYDTDQAFTTFGDAVSFYNRQAATNNTGNAALLSAQAENQSLLFLHRDDTNDQYSLGFVHDRIGSAAAGSITENLTVSQVANSRNYSLPGTAFSTAGTAASFYNYSTTALCPTGAFNNASFIPNLDPGRMAMFLHRNTGDNRYSLGFVAGRPGGLVSRWGFDNNTTNWYAGRGNGTLLSVSGTAANVPAYVSTAPVLGQALRFNGTDGYVQIPHHPSFLIDEGAVSLWFNANVMGEDRELFSKDRWGNTDGGHFQFGIDSLGTLSSRIQSTSDQSLITDTSLISTGSWYFVVVTFGPTGHRLYLNGSQVAAEPGWTSGLGTSAGGSGNQEAIIIGASSHRNTTAVGAIDSSELVEFFNGLIDEVRIYNRQLSAAEITNIYNNERTMAETNAARFSFSNISGGAPRVAVRDDDGAADASPALGTDIANGNTWNFLTNLQYCTDGGMLLMPAGDNWTIDIAPDIAFNGINNWRFFGSGAAFWDAPALNQSIRLTYARNVITASNDGSQGSFNISAGTLAPLDAGLTGALPNLSWDHDETAVAGGLVSFPAGASDWSVTIEPSFDSGIDSWRFLRSSLAPGQDLNRSQPLTLSLVETPITETIITTTGNNSDWGCTIDTGDKILLGAAAETCTAANEGCHEFIRTRPGVNLLVNGGFEDGLDGWTITPRGAASTIEIAQDPVFEGRNSLRINHDYAMPGAEYSPAVARVDGVIPGETYSVSYNVLSNVENRAHYGAWLVVWSLDSAGVYVLDSGASVLTETYPASQQWRRHSFSFTAPANTAFFDIEVRVQRISGQAYFDAIKVEKAAAPSAYSRYGEGGRVYLKLAPDYLNCTGGGSDPAECGRFVRECSAAELGCNFYTAHSDGMVIPARLAMDDYCPAECAGYDEYVQRPSTFDSETFKRFIPATARTCSAQTAGCDEFTNLDRLGQGAEAREYYRELKQCVVESAETPNPGCSDFYTWEGSSETGYQLRTFRLMVDGDLPALTNRGDYNGLSCISTTTYDLEANPMCREFYNRAGERFYRFLPYTITCSDDCHPYRRTAKNILLNPATAVAACQYDCAGNLLCLAQCGAIDCETQSNSRVCAFDDGTAAYCKNGGVWRHDHQSCLYYAIPAEGVVCGAAAAGCREYTGSSGYNIRRLLADNFESGHTDGWSGWSGTAVSPDSSSLLVGGHSLRVQTNPWTIEKDVSSLVQEGKTYVVRFLARSPIDTVITAGISSAPSATNFNGQANTRTIWQIFELNTDIIDWDTSGTVVLQFTGNNDFYIDDIQLIEVRDRYYLISDSWQTPESCYYDIAGNFRGPEHNLGCEAFSDREGGLHYASGFSQLCSDDSVGCELMIDTHNYSRSAGGIWFDSDASGDCDPAAEPDCRTVPPDEFRYVVYNPQKLCNASDKGCQLLGRPYYYEDERLYTGVYLKNDPDRYDRTLCRGNDANCQSWNAGEYSVNFRDPGDQVCEYRAVTDEHGTMSGWNWYRKKIKRCDINNNGRIDTGETSICLSDSDCRPFSCIRDENDYLCPIDSLKTIGYGGQGNRVFQPIENFGHYWAGLCPAEQSGCTEYIDPSSRFNANLIFNPAFADLGGGGPVPDGWTQPVGGGRIYQVFEIKSHTLYRFSGRLTGPSTLECNHPFLLLASVNVGPIQSLTAISLNFDDEPQSRLIYSHFGTVCTAFVTNYDPLAGPEIELRQTAVEYQLKQNVDRSSCNGLVDSNSGCVLFNERAYGSSGYTPLRYDADLTINLKTPASPRNNGEENNSNTIIKVSPNRTCDQWLACKTFVREKEENICYDLGLCDGMDDSGNCVSFVREEERNQSLTLANRSEFANKSGYTVSGLRGSNFNAGLFPLGAMSQAGAYAPVPNGGFELYNESQHPAEWSPSDAGAWEPDNFRVIRNPYEAEREGIKYKNEGWAFLKLGASREAFSEFIDVSPGTSYVISALANTLNLGSGAAMIGVFEYDANNGYMDDDHVEGLSLNAGEDWTALMGEFSPGPGTHRIKIELYADSVPFSGTPVGGNVYFDDIKIRSVLHAQNEAVSGDNVFLPQSCRLYPAGNALSCEYYEESGIKTKGLYGYCLEYDRSPGADDACLLWYPVDRTKDDNIGVGESGAGYTGATPVYYCQNAAMNVPVEKRRIFNEGSNIIWGGCNGQCVSYINHFSCPPGYQAEVTVVDAGTCPRRRKSFLGVFTIREGVPGQDSQCRAACVAREEYAYLVEGNHGWFDYTGDLLPDFVADRELSHISIPAETGIKFYSPLRQEVDDALADCQVINQVVTLAGENKYWSGRVAENSEYTANIPTGIEYNYSTSRVPFGAVSPPSFFGPNHWSIMTGRPLPVTNLNIANAGKPYSVFGVNSPSGIRVGLCQQSKKLCFEPNRSDSLYMCAPGEVCQLYQDSGLDTAVAELQRLFAQSYGSWAWSDAEKRYVESGDIETRVGRCSGNPLQSCYTNICEPPQGCDHSPADSANVCINSTYAGPCTGNCTGGATCVNRSRDHTIMACADGTVCCSGSFATLTSCPGNCVLYGDGYYRCRGNPSSYCAPAEYAFTGAVYTHACTSGATQYTLAEQASCTGCAPSVLETVTISRYVCSDSALNQPVTECCPGTNSSCEYREQYTCDGLSRADGGRLCTGHACEGAGYCDLSNPIISLVTPVWTPPETPCPAAGRPPRPNDWCYIAPAVSNIGANGILSGSGFVPIRRNGVVRYYFNTRVDDEQMPLVMYRVNWGDGETTLVGNMEMAPRTNENNPHVLYHLYDYYDVYSKRNDLASITCPPPPVGSSAYCDVSTRVLIKDNWGRCNGVCTEIEAGTAGVTIRVYEN